MKMFHENNSKQWLSDWEKREAINFKGKAGPMTPGTKIAVTKQGLCKWTAQVAGL